MDFDLTRYKKELFEKKKQLNENFLKNNNPKIYMQGLSRYTDQLIQDIWVKIDMSDENAVVAVGGYGRGALHPCSDIDILILVPSLPNEKEANLLSLFIRLLWDIGLDIGHSVRTIKDCVHESMTDVTIMTTFLETRKVSGASELFYDFKVATNKNLNPVNFVDMKLREQAHRHNQANDVAFSLEPNLKNCPGGLRDLHLTLWIAQALNLGNTWKQLHVNKIINKYEYLAVCRYQNFLNRIRIYLHLETKRGGDRLSFDHQIAIAKKIGMNANQAIQPSEQLMKVFYRTVRSVSLITKIINQNMVKNVISETKIKSIRISEDYLIKNKLLEISSNDLFLNQPKKLIDIFHVWQKKTDQIDGLAVNTMRQIWRLTSTRHRLKYIVGGYNIFLKILRYDRHVATTLRRMNEHKILGLHIPAFSKIVGQMQHDLFHIYTVDEHTLMVVNNLRRFAISVLSHENPLCSELMSSFKNPHILYIAAIFHDIAKGRGGNHSKLGMLDAKKFCNLHNLNHRDTELIVWLVENHLLMSSFSQKYDFENAFVRKKFTQAVGTKYRLIALYLFTVADIRATSDKVWNSWKAKLLENLFRLTIDQIKQKKTSSDNAHSFVASKKKRAIKSLESLGFKPSVFRHLWNQLDYTYFFRYETSEIVWHTKSLLLNANKKLPLVKGMINRSIEGIDVFVFAKDRKELFSQICGFFHNINLQIVDAKLYTSQENFAIDTFRLLKHDKASTIDIDKIEENLTEKIILNRSIPYSKKQILSAQQRYLPIDPVVEFKPEGNGLFYYLNIISADKPGLLHRISSLLAQNDITIQTAKINTLGGKVEDSFLIKGQILGNAQKIMDLELLLLRLLKD